MSEKNIKHYQKRLQELRDAAEVSLSLNTLPPHKLAPPKSQEELLHELQVNQIELEMQYEELRQAHVTLEESRDRHLDMYDFSPIGHFNLTQDGLISAINLTGADMLGVERKRLLKRPFSRFVSVKDSDRWHLMLRSLLRNEAKQNIELGLMHANGSVFNVRLDCLRIEVEGEPSRHDWYL